MRICYIADGRYIHSYRWVRFFSERGHDIHFISFQPVAPQHIQTIEEAGATYHGELGPFHIKRFWRTAGDLKWLRYILRRERIDILHCHFLGVNVWYAALSGFRPFVITVMGGGDVCGPDWKPVGLRAKLLTPLALHRADLVTSWSDLMARVVRPYCRDDVRVEIIHGGIELDLFRPGPKPAHLLDRLNIPAGAKIVFSPRLMRPLSNIDQIAKTIANVCEKEPDTYFLFLVPSVAKDRAYEAMVSDIINCSGMVERTRIIEGVAHDQMPDYYRLSDVTISIPATDGTPMTVLESMACGTPVIVSDIPDYDAQYIEPGETVLSARVDDPEKIETALLMLLRNPALSTKLTIEARRRIEASGSYEAQMSRMEQLYMDRLGLLPLTPLYSDGIKGAF